jgi:hypothetical protein
LFLALRDDYGGVGRAARVGGGAGVGQVQGPPGRRVSQAGTGEGMKVGIGHS